MVQRLSYFVQRKFVYASVTWIVGAQP